MAKDLTRNDLYELVWQRPITEVAKEYGLSDRGLSKLCERYGIPVPPRGYWAKINNGHKVHAPQLISLNSNVDNKVVIVSNARVNTHKLPDNLKEALEAEKLPENKIIVQENISHRTRRTTKSRHNRYRTTKNRGSRTTGQELVARKRYTKLC